MLSASSTVQNATPQLASHRAFYATLQLASYCGFFFGFRGVISHAVVRQGCFLICVGIVTSTDLQACCKWILPSALRRTMRWTIRGWHLPNRMAMEGGPPGGSTRLIETFMDDCNGTVAGIKNWVGTLDDD